MKKNLIQFQKGFSLTSFMQKYGTERQCAEALFQARWASAEAIVTAWSKLATCINARHDVSPPNFANQRHAVRTNLAAADGVVSSDSLADTSQNRFVGVDAANRRNL